MLFFCLKTNKISWEGYDAWVNRHYNASEVLIINIDKYDYVNNENEVIKFIEDKLKEVRSK